MRTFCKYTLIRRKEEEEEKERRNKGLSKTNAERGKHNARADATSRVNIQGRREAQGKCLVKNVWRNFPISQLRPRGVVDSATDSRARDRRFKAH